MTLDSGNRDRVQLSGARVKEIREKLGLSQAGLARLVGVSSNAIRSWETNEYPCSGPAARHLLVLEAIGPQHIPRRRKR